MAEQEFVVSPAKVIDHTRLDRDIRLSIANYSGSGAQYNTSGEATKLVVNSPTALSGGNTTTIEGIIASHTPVALPALRPLDDQQYHITTANATATAMMSTTPGNPNFVADIPQHCILHVEYLLIAVKTDESAYKKWHGEIALSRGGNGAAWPGGTFDDYFVKTIGTITASRTGALSGNKPIVTVTGAASTTIQWSLYTRTLKYTL